MSAGEQALEAYLQLFAPQLTPTREYKFCKTRRWRFDFAFVAQKVAIEIDGGQWKARGGRHATDKDREKLNKAAAQGWRVLRYSPEMLNAAPDMVVAEIVETLGMAA